MEIENIETIFVLVTQQINQHKLSSLKYITKMYSALSITRHAFLFKTHLSRENESRNYRFKLI